MGYFVSLNYRNSSSKTPKDEDIGVVINYYYKGKKLRKSVGVEVKPKDWNSDDKENPIRKSDPQFRTKNLFIRQKMVELGTIVQKITLNGQLPTVELVNYHLSKVIVKKEENTKREYDFFIVVEEYLREMKSDSRLSVNYLRTLVNCIYQFKLYIKEELKQTYFPLDDINEDFQKGFYNYSTKEKNRINTTTKKHLSHLQKFLRWSVKNRFTNTFVSNIPINTTYDREVLFFNRNELVQLSMFTDFDFKSEVHSRYTSEYFHVTLKNGNIRTFTNLEVYKDMLVFGCGLGCRFGDLIKLKIDNYHFDDTQKGFGHFVFRMEKSNVGKQVKVPINQLTLDIFKKYSSGRTRYDNIFPLSQRGCLVSNQKFNQHIKVIGEVVGLNRWVSRPSFTPDGKVKKGTDIREPLYKYITSHIMRRTFIREGINNNLPYHIIMSMSGHSNEKVFRKYFSTTEDELKDGGSKMFSLNIEPKKEVRKDEGVDELTKLISEMDEGKKKLFLQLISSMKEG